ncbi:MAG: FGGY-family carbohydrate kinase [Pseudomonadota bacterium]
MTDLALGLDLGTSGVRSAVVSGAGEVVATARASYGPGGDDGGDPTRWWAAVAECLSAQADALAGAGHSMGEVARLGVDGTSGTVVLADSEIEPVTRALMYNDGGFDEEAERIARFAPDPHVARGSGSALARALRLQAEDREGRARHLLHQADFVAARLAGRGGFSDFNNALKTGADPATGSWPDWLGELLSPSLLPELFPPGAPVAHVASEMARKFGFGDHMMVHTGTTDSIAAFLAAARPEPGAAVTSLGTTLAIKLFSNKRIDAPELGLYAHRIGEGWLVGGASNTGGGVLRSFFKDEEIEDLSRQIDPSVSSGLDYYPLPKPGERFPINDPTLSPRLAPRPENDALFLHGILEGIARIERLAYDALAEKGAPYPKAVITAGGGAQNATWRDMRQRILGVPVVAVSTTEASVGTALLVQSFA